MEKDNVVKLPGGRDAKELLENLSKNDEIEMVVVLCLHKDGYISCAHSYGSQMEITYLHSYLTFLINNWFER